MAIKSLRLVTRNLNEFKKFAKEFANFVIRLKKRKSAIVIGLVGPLGAGKTTFVRSFLKVFDVKEKIISPTFLIIRSYELAPAVIKKINTDIHRVFHIDVYRLNNAKEIIDLGFKKIISNPGHIVLIEWADKIKSMISKDAIWLEFEFGEKEKERIIKSTTSGHAPVANG